ncbi:MAG: Rieske 2Fe-2S domain-containing protein [Azovibrio sp.]|uniref:Rieske (2Fe-2S) protein n=1 Tax=Azovibrio sp. TaxID=1872673 RepID=UPI003C70735E
MAAGARLICASADLVEGGRGIRFDLARGGSPVPAFLVRYRGKPRAYLNRCGHVPVELDWQPGEFFDSTGLYLICAVHGALFAPETGLCLAGRCAGRGLEPLPVEERPDGIFFLES